MPKSLSDTDRDAIHAEIFAGRKIQAIKLYRTATGDGLKDAKDAVEAMEKTLRQTDAGRFEVKSGRGGCMSAIVVAMTIAAALAYKLHG